MYYANSRQVYRDRTQRLCLRLASHNYRFQAEKKGNHGQVFVVVVSLPRSLNKFSCCRQRIFIWICAESGCGVTVRTDVDGNNEIFDRSKGTEHKH